MGNKIHDNILKYKTELMGVAICLIIWFHSIYTVNNAALSFIKNICDIGVDIFMFLSGFSLAYSFSKDSNVKHFYKKRFLRILPTYFLIFFFVYLYHDLVKQNGNICDVLYNLLFLNFFLDGNIFIWFIPVILVYYLITPLYIKLVRYNNKITYLPYIVAILLILFIVFDIKISHGFLWLRLPIYLLGINLYFNKDKKNHSLLLFILSIMCLVGCYYCLNIDRGLFGLKYLLYIPIVATVIYTYRSLNYLKTLLAFLGGITLEIYLLHERIQWLLDNYINNQLILCVISIVITIVLSYCIKLFIIKSEKHICKTH